tara:strand:+ start:59 stop:196 length:138 start_codon:yes stop_codon:yes gene_type:complete
MAKTSINDKKGIAETKVNRSHEEKIVITKFFSFRILFLLNSTLKK